ncbi:MAG TPA: prenyltransferase/squalene oxidase repeat-containing protein [Luteolibacter sp.]|nr:prenyltransferase/squalene oxidase repeat-containing protein [Luteolibacter sp.]
MSLHAQLSPEALERLHRQRRNSTISSIAIAILTVALIALALGIFLLPSLYPDTPTIVTYKASLDEDLQQEEKKTQTKIQRKPTPPASSRTKVIVANTVSPTAVQVPDVDVTTPSLEFGDMDLGSNWGGGGGLGGGFANVPASMKKRCSPEDRAARLLETGGTPECEEAVMKSLRWMAKTQKPDGSWGSQHAVAMTGFSLLAYLGHCETPLSPEFGDNVLRALTYLVNVGLKKDYRLTDKDAGSIQWVYEHGIATYALAEAYTFCKSLSVDIPQLAEVTEKATQIIIDGQGQSGGWVYKFEPTTGGDNSVGFWQIQALKAAKHTGLFNESKLNRTARKALDWLEKVQGKNGAIGYRNDSNRSPGLTGGGVLAFQMWDKATSSAARSGIKYIAKNSEFKWGEESANLYYHYYNAQAMINRGGSEWKDYNERFREELIKAQKPDGSWDKGAGGNHGAIDEHMATCLATLMLEVYYRFLPGTGAVN